MSQWHGGKGSAQRPIGVSKEEYDANWEKIFGAKNMKEKQQDLTELNGDGNRERGRYGEDLTNE